MDVTEQPEFVTGKLLLIDKDLDWTSFDAVNKLRYEIKRKLGVKKIKVGHAGTLDPLATGLLIICTGKFTKKLGDLQGLTKEYTGTITLGKTTASFDLESVYDDKTFDYDHLSEEQILETAKSFLGSSMQTPPIFSAKKIDGEKAYIKARKGEEVVMKLQEVIIDEFEVTNINLPNVDFRIVCSKGTYIRSIANDFGQRLENGSHLSALRRTKIGEYDVKDAVTVTEFIEELKK
jgi:tRNA pseudouridine55 synthase